MDNYTLLRQFADSWVLLALFGFFLAVVIWAFLPSQSKAREDASKIPFRDEKPAGHAPAPVKENTNGGR